MLPRGPANTSGMSTQTFDEAQHPRETGGQFATKAVGEATGGMDALAPDATRPLIDELDSSGDIMLSVFEHQDDVFTTVSVHHEPGDEVLGLTAGVSISPQECLADFMPAGLDDDEREAGLDERSYGIAAWLSDEYRVERLDGDGWEQIEAQFEIIAPLDLSTGDLTEYLRDETKAVALYNESDPGTYGSRNLWTDLGNYLQAHDTAVSESASAYITAALWTATTEGDDGEDGELVQMDSRYTLADLAPATIAKAHDDLSRFLVTNRKDIAAAKAANPDYDDAQIGNDFFLTRNRHGAGFWDRGIGEAGDALTEAAHRAGETELYAGDDGKLYFSPRPARCRPQGVTGLLALDLADVYRQHRHPYDLDQWEGEGEVSGSRFDRGSHSTRG